MVRWLVIDNCILDFSLLSCTYSSPFTNFITLYEFFCKKIISAVLLLLVVVHSAYNIGYYVDLFVAKITRQLLILLSSTFLSMLKNEIIWTIVVD